MVSNPVSFFGFVLLMLVLACAVLWVYRDASRRGNAPLPWAALVFFTTAIGFFIYLVFRNRR